MRKYLLSVWLLAICTNAQSAVVDMSSATLNLYDNVGNIIFTDNTITGYVETDGHGTWSIASDTPMFGLIWNAHSGITLAPGSYDVDWCEAPLYSNCIWPVNVGLNQLGGLVFIDWIDSGITDSFFYNVWDISSNKFTPTDTDGDGIPGRATTSGPFYGHNMSIEFTVVPIHPAIWLFGFGLISLVGLARRKA